MAKHDELPLRVIDHGSPEYADEVALRRTVLRIPLGLDFTADELSGEASWTHLGCYLNDHLVACLILKSAAAGSIQMKQVAVDASHQGQGIGRVLVGYAEHFAREREYTHMFLHARETALPFYEKLGYVKQSGPFIEVTLPHWEMSKDL